MSWYQDADEWLSGGKEKLAEARQRQEDYEKESWEKSKVVYDFILDHADPILTAGAKAIDIGISHRTGLPNIPWTETVKNWAKWEQKKGRDEMTELQKKLAEPISRYDGPKFSTSKEGRNLAQQVKATSKLSNALGNAIRKKVGLRSTSLRNERAKPGTLAQLAQLIKKQTKKKKIKGLKKIKGTKKKIPSKTEVAKMIKENQAVIRNMVQQQKDGNSLNLTQKEMDRKEAAARKAHLNAGGQFLPIAPFSS